MEAILVHFDHLCPMGEARQDALRLDFDRRMKLEFHGTKVTSDTGLPVYRELEAAFPGGVLAMSVTRSLDINVPILVLLTMWRAGVPSYDGKWQIPAENKYERTGVLYGNHIYIVGLFISIRRKTKQYASWVLLVCIVMIIGCFVIWTDRSFTVYNDNFKILDYSISEGKVHTVYKGNQTVGRVRAKLKHQFGLRFIGESPASQAHTPGFRVFLLRYKGEFPFEELDDLRAVLTNDKNIFKELAVMKMFALDGNTFIRGCILPRLPTSNDSFRIDFKLKSADDPIASCRVGELYRHNNGIQSATRTSGR